MMEALSKLVKDILTGVDKETYDNGRVLCLCSFFIYFVMAIGSLGESQPWTAMDFAGGIGAMAVGFGINLHIKRHTEPQPRKEEDNET